MKPGPAEFLEKYSVSGVRAYVLTAIGIAGATALRVSLNPYFGDSSTYSLQVLVVLLSASLAGHGPGLFAVALAIGLGLFALPPYGLPLGENVMNHVASAFAGVMICIVTTTMRSALFIAAAARREADFLCREMHHRVKNLFAVVGSMITLSAREEPQARDALIDLRARLQALANAHDVVIESCDYVNIADLMGRLMAPHVMKGTEEGRIRINGAPLHLAPAYMTPLTLIINELATNAVKYGSLSTRHGSVRLSWERRDDMLDILWAETFAEQSKPSLEPGTPGFGSLLVEASVAQLRGKLDRTLTDDGMVVRLVVPCVEPEQKQFRSGTDEVTHGQCGPPHSSLSALRVSKRFFRRKPQIRDSRS